MAQSCQNDRKGSGHRKGPRPEHPQCLLHWRGGKLTSVMQASRVGAPANGSTIGWKSDFSLSLRKFGPCRWTFLWIDCFLGKIHRSEGAEIQGHCRAPTHRRSLNEEISMFLPTCGISETTRRSKSEEEVRRKCEDYPVRHLLSVCLERDNFHWT